MRAVFKTCLTAAVAGLVGGAVWLLAQEQPVFRVKVDMVVLSFTITDNKGHYVNGLKPSDFRILEDGITQKLSTFSEGNKPPVEVAADGSVKPIVVDNAGAAPGARIRSTAHNAEIRLSFIEIP